MYKRYRKKKQAGSGFPLVAAALPFAKAALPWLGKAALDGATSFGASKILSKILGGGKRKKRYKRKKRKTRYSRYVR